MRGETEGEEDEAEEAEEEEEAEASAAEEEEEAAAAEDEAAVAAETEEVARGDGAASSWLSSALPSAVAERRRISAICAEAGMILNNSFITV